MNKGLKELILAPSDSFPVKSRYHGGYDDRESKGDSGIAQSADDRILQEPY
jgi:hypothetical protein